MTAEPSVAEVAASIARDQAELARLIRERAARRERELAAAWERELNQQAGNPIMPFKWSKTK